MSVNELINMASDYREWLAGFFLTVPILAFFISLAVKPISRLRVVDYFLSIIIYFSAIPGMFSSVLLFYSLFIAQHDLLDVDILIYFLPIFSMVTVFYLIGRKTDFELLPGFGRLSGLMLMLLLVCIVAWEIGKRQKRGL